MWLGLGLRLAGRRGGGAPDPFTSLMTTLSTGAAQLIAHPLEYGSMFQDRLGTVPVTEPGQLVGHCLDAGPGGYHATAISDAARGIFREVDGVRYIEYNGINTAYETPALPAPGVDKAQVFAGLRKLSDAAQAAAVGLSILPGARAGSLEVSAPGGGLSNQPYVVRSYGTLNAFAIAPAGAYDAPVTNILAAFADISADRATLRVDGIQAAQSTGDQGTGNYNPSGTYPLFYGARAGTSIFFEGNHYATLGPIVRFSATNASAAQIEAAEAYFTGRIPS